MSDVIQRVGEYDQTCDEQRRMKARVEHIENGRAFWFDCDGDPDHWDAATGEADATYDIKGLWIPDPPAPPEGFAVMPRDYVAKAGDRVFAGTTNRWVDVTGWAGCSVVQLEGELAARIPTYIASPIPKPFRISDKGCGVYARRDGVEKKVVSTARREWRGEFYVWADDVGWTYRDDGVVCHQTTPSPLDLVRYISPLPEPEPQEQWVPTCELRWKQCKSGDGGGVWIWEHDKVCPRQILARQEQRWTCGEKSEWRPVGVEK